MLFQRIKTLTRESDLINKTRLTTGTGIEPVSRQICRRVITTILTSHEHT